MTLGVDVFLHIVALTGGPPGSGHKYKGLGTDTSGQLVHCNYIQSWPYPFASHFRHSIPESTQLKYTIRICQLAVIIPPLTSHVTLCAESDILLASSHATVSGHGPFLADFQTLGRRAGTENKETVITKPTVMIQFLFLICWFFSTTSSRNLGSFYRSLPHPTSNNNLRNQQNVEPFRHLISITSNLVSNSIALISTPLHSSFLHSLQNHHLPGSTEKQDIFGLRNKRKKGEAEESDQKREGKNRSTC